mgnify:CR=1 FL=1
MGLSRAQDMKAVLIKLKELRSERMGMTYSEIMNFLVNRAYGWTPQNKPHLFSKKGNFKTSSISADFKGFTRLKDLFLIKIGKVYTLRGDVEMALRNEDIERLKFWSRKTELRFRQNFGPMGV